LNLKFINDMHNPSLDGVRTFLAVAEHRSFTIAAQRLGMTPTAASKSVKAMELRHGVVLFRRTTRSVTLTEAGAALFASLGAATQQIDEAFDALTAWRDRPAGNLRLTVPRALGALVLRRVVPDFRRRHPGVSLDISLDDGTVDLVAQGFDAGIRLGHAVARDMVAVRLTPDLAWSVVGTPAYLNAAGRPARPEDLVDHETIRYRFVSTGLPHRWRFRRGRQTLTVDTAGGLVVDDTALIAEFARASLGLAYLPDMEITEDLDAGRLERVLHTFVPPTAGLYLYFPARTQQQPKLRAFIDMATSLAGAG
jgi:DNA-binding transcriptional LysR family regulator